MDTTRTAKAGKLLCVDSGEYSDYSVTGFFVVLQDFNPMEKLVLYLNAHPEEKNTYRFDRHKFLACLIADGFLLEIDYGTLYMGGYESADGVSFAPANTV